MSLIDIYYPDDEDEEELEKKKILTPSQKAGIEQKQKGSLLDTYYPAKEEPEPEPEEEKEPFLKKAGKKVSEFAGKAAEKVSEFLFGEEELISPIPMKPEAVEISDEEYALHSGKVSEFRQETVLQLEDAEKELDDFYMEVAPPWATYQKTAMEEQFGGTPRYDDLAVPNKHKEEFYEKRKTVQALQLAIKDYDQFLGNEQARRGVIKQVWESLKSEGEETLIPFAKGNYDAFVYTKEREALEKYDQGVPLTAEEKRFIQTYRARAYNNLVDKGLGADAGDVMAGIPKFALEIYMTAGLVNPVTKATGGVILKSSAPAIVKKIAPKLLDNSVKMALASNLNIPGISGATAEYMLPIVDYEEALKTDDILSELKSGDEPGKAREKAYLSNLVEYVTEGVGGYIDDALPFVKKAFLGKWLTNNKIPKNPGAIKAALKNAYFGSLAGEVIEEEIGEPIQSIIQEREYQDPFFTPEGRERLLVEILGIGMFSGMSRVPDVFMSQVKKYRKETGTDTIDIPVDKEAKEEEIELPDVIKEEIEKKPEVKPEEPKEKPKPEGETETLGKDTVVFRGAKDQTVDVTKEEGITGGVSFSVDKSVADRFAKKTGGAVKEFTISKDAIVINHSVLEGLDRNEVKDYIEKNKIDVIRFDVPPGAKGEAELRVVNARVLQEGKPAEEPKEKEPEHIEKGKKLAKGLKEEDAFKLALEAYRPYVERGETLKQMKAGQFGSTLGDFVGNLSTGGYLNKKKMPADTAIVELADGRNFTFKLRKFYDELGFDVEGKKVEPEKKEKPKKKPKGKKAITKKSEDYFKVVHGTDKGQTKFDKVKGKPVEVHKDLDTFIHKGEPSGWTVSEAKSGMIMANAKLQKDAIKEAKEAVSTVGIEKVQGLVDKALDKSGLSPRYSAKIKHEEPTDISRTKAGQKELPDTVRKGKVEPEGAKKRPAKPSKAARGKREVSDAELRERSATRITPSEQVDINKGIETLIKVKGILENYKWTTKEKELLKLYTGSGGLEKGGAEGRGLLDEYYTPKPIVGFMWEKVFDFGLSKNKVKSVLEPSAGIGNFLEEVKDVKRIDAYEIDKTSATIASILYPKAQVLNKPFEDLFIDSRGNKKRINDADKYDVVIGNPPYGEHRGRYLGLGEESKIVKYEEYFLKRGLDLLNDDGVIAYVMPSGFLRSVSDVAKEEIAKLGDIQVAYRLPNGIFGTTDIGTDIVVFGKTPTLDGSTSNDRIEIARRTKDISNDKYFADNPDNVLGKVLKGKGNYGSDLVEGTLDQALIKAGYQETGKIEKAPKATPKSEVPKEEEVTERVEAPKKVTNAANKKAIIVSTKKDKTIYLSDITKVDKELWAGVEATGELSKSYLEKHYPGFEAKTFNNAQIAVDVAVPTNFGMANKLYPNIIYYQGNIYEKLDNLKKHKNDLHPSQHARQKAGLEKVLPTPRKISEITLRPNSDFAKDLRITREGTRTEVLQLFKNFMRDLPYQVFGDTSSWEIDRYIEGRIVNTGDKIRNVKIRRERRKIGDSLFKRFLAEELSPAERKQIENKYNRTFNAYHRPDYKKVPLLAKINKSFKGNGLKMTDLQKEGASFLSLKGSGLLGYEVGLGKTLTAIVAINESMQKGWARKPLIVVPNAVYLQWMNEIQEVIPGVKINSLANLGGKFKGDLKSLEIEDGTISMITYSGLSKLGFRMSTYDKLTVDLKDVMAGVSATKRAAAREAERVGEVIGKAVKGTNGDRFFEDLGFDHITIDEVHNFKNIFAGAKLERGKGNEYRNVRGSTSARGIKAYLMAQYILKNNNERNVFLLSATPFTNSPLEIYSIMSLMGKKRLEEIDLKNVNDFMSMFVNMKPTFVVKANQTVKQEDVVESFFNLQQLQKLVTEFVDFRTGEEVGIERPDRRKKTLSLHPNQQQVDYVEKAQKLFDDKEKGGAIVAITELQNITLSPFMSRYSKTTPTYKQFVENSPKIKFAVEAVAQVRKDKPEVGQVIYMPRGVQFFPLLRQYLIKEKGIKANEIGIIKGGMSIDSKHSIQNKFNKGDIKVLIGTEAIKEGVNLQENSTDLYHLHLPWNPTDMLQIEGRVWRQGNKWENVRIHYPLIENSVDSFIFQKLETKEKRIKNLWSYKEDNVNVGDLDFETMKLDLITDPVIRVSAEQSFVTEKENVILQELKSERAYASRRMTALEKLEDSLKDSKEWLADARKEKDDSNVNYYTKRVKEVSRDLSKAKSELKKQGLDVAKLKERMKKFDDRIETQEKVIEGLIKKFEAKRKVASKKRLSTIVKPNEYDKLMGDIAEENKTFFVKKKVLKAKYKKAPGGTAEVGGYADVKSVEKDVAGIKAVEMPELVRIAKMMMGETPTLKRFRKSLGRFYAVNRGLIKLSPDIFKNPELAAKVMAHEIGHGSDFLDDKTMVRGNLAGRIASLNRHLKDKFGKLSNKELRKELKDLTQIWKPFDEDANEGFTAYRYSSKELYADAISVLFNDPVMLKKEAPKFWKGFFDYMDKKPSVKKNFLSIWNLLNQGEEAVFKARDKELERGFKRGEEAFAAKEMEKQKKTTSLMYQLQLSFDDKNTPVIRKLRQEQKAGRPVKPKDNPEFALHGFNYTDGKLKNYVNDNFQPVFAKAQSVNNGWETLGKILFYERVINERGELANPQGYSPKTAESQLDMMEKHTSKEEWKTLQEAKEGFRKAVKKSVDRAEKHKFYTPELIKQMKMNPAYATYQVVDYLDTYISARVYKSVGTLKDIANPATSTIMKLISVEKAIERNNVKKLSIRFFKERFPESVERAKTKWNGKFMQIKDPSDPSIGLVVTIENGKPQGYYMERDIADTLNFTSSKTLYAAARISRALSQSRFYRPLFTSFNLGFQTFNFVRDFMRYWKNVPDYTIGRAITSFPRAIGRYVQATPHAAKRALHLKSDLVTDMENAKIIGLTYNDMFRSGEIDKHRPQIERVMDKAGVLQNTKRRKLLLPFHWVLDTIETTGNFIETLPKVAGYIELKDKMPKEQLAEFIRTSVGSPDFRIGGTMTPVSNNIFLFSNAIKEGIKTDFKIAFTKNQSRAGFWWKTTISTFLPKFIMAAIAYGLFGDELKKLMDKASEYDKTNYNIIPLYEDENGKAVYIRVPQDETGRLFGGLLWKMLNITKDKKTVQDVFDVFSFGAGQFPNLSPSFTSAGVIVAYASGKNPYDSFRGRSIIPDKEFAAGTKYSLPILMSWLAKNQGAGIFFPTDYNYYHQQETDLQKALKVPFFSNIIGRWIKVSDYGETEKLRDITKPIKQEQAQRQLEEREKLDEALKEYKSGTENMTRKMAIEKQLVKDIVGEPPYKDATKTKATNTKKKFRIAILRGEADPVIGAVISAGNNAEKVTLLNEIKQTMGAKEYKELIKTLLKNKVISKDVANETR